MLLLYAWIAIATIGVIAGLGVLVDSLRFRSYVRKNRPDLVVTFRLEIVRDTVLFIIHCLNLSIGYLSLYSAETRQYTVARPIAIIALLAVAALLALTSVFNYVLRHRGPV